MKILEDKDIIIAILALATPILTIFGGVIGKIIDFRNERRQKSEERNNSRRNEIYIKFLDIIDELVIDNLKLFEDSYYRELIHSINEVQLYAGKKSREYIKKLKVYINNSKEEFTKNIIKDGYDNIAECVRGFAEYDDCNTTEAEIKYYDNLKDLKLSCIDTKKINLELEKIIDSMNEELLKDK